MSRRPIAVVIFSYLGCLSPRLGRRRFRYSGRVAATARRINHTFTLSSSTRRIVI